MSWCGVLATAPADRPGDCEVKWMVGGNGAPAVRASGWRGPECGFTDAEGRKGRAYRICLSDYYNSPGRLAVFRRRFESAIRRPGMDPATFATELGILAVRGFGDMGKRARDAMIRDKFIAAQRNCGLRRHLDGVPLDTPIWEIVDSCRV